MKIRKKKNIDKKKIVTMLNSWLSRFNFISDLKVV